MPKVCSAYRCPNSDRDESNRERGISFHRFPLRRAGVLEQWLQNLGRSNFKPTESSRLCSDHFDEQCFEHENFTNRRFLKKDAVPTKFFTAEEWKNAHGKQMRRTRAAPYAERIKQLEMSCVDSKNKSQTINISPEGTTTISGKPCIDFQPGDRWQIKDEDTKKEMAKPTINELKNGGRRSLRLRSAKSTDSNSAVNGEGAGSGSDGENHSKDGVGKNSNRKRKEPETEHLQDCSSSKKVKTNKVQIQNSLSAGKSENGSKNAVEESDDGSKDGVEESDDGSKDGIEESDDGSKEGVDESDGSKDEVKTGDKAAMPCLSPAAEKGKNLPKDSKDQKLNEKVEEIENADEKNSKDKLKKTDDKDSKPVPSVDKESNDCIEIDASTPNGSESKDDADIEIINEEKKSEDSESDSEVQIINPEALEEIATSKAVPCFPTAQSSDSPYTLTAGFPFYNSLKEKINNFKAGDYKPVKFPHTGTLFLGENEVIIESPSLLVPLLIKEADDFPTLEGDEKKTNGSVMSTLSRAQISKRNFFQSSVGQFLINLGKSRVMEFYTKDLKRTKTKYLKAAGGKNESILKEIKDLDKKIDGLKQTNAAFNSRMHRCKFCDFKSESLIVMEGHYLIPHLTPRREYRCNFCNFIVRDITGIVRHYSEKHKKRAILDSYIPFHECPFCPFQSHLKNKVNAHLTRCRKHFIPSQNLSPPFDFEFPGVTTKPVTINDVVGHRRMLLNAGKGPRIPGQDDGNSNSILAKKKLASVLSRLSGPGSYDMKNPNLMKQLMNQNQMTLSGSNLALPPGIVISRPRGQAPPVVAPLRFKGPRGMTPVRNLPPRRDPYVTNLNNTASQLASAGISITPISRASPGIPAKTLSNTKNVTLTPISAVSNRAVSQKPGPPQPVALFTNMAGSNSNLMGQSQIRGAPASVQLRPLRPAPPYQRLNTPPSQVVKGAAGNTFVVCEICDSYIKDLEELRTHMNWVHKVKIHPKMLVSRPPLNCQKCHWRFFTDQGLERHLLGAHGLVTTNMQEMANKNQDGGRCIICGAVFTYKLVSHMTQVHKVTLKPAHLSYKCTVCTATFTLYRLFESHVYNVHSGAGKRNAEEASSSEQPALKKMAVETGARRCRDCSMVTENMQEHLIKKHMKNCAIRLCHIEKCEKCLNSSDEMLVITMADFGLGDLDSGDDSSDEESSEESEDENCADSKSDDKDELAKTGDPGEKAVDVAKDKEDGPS